MDEYDYYPDDLLEENEGYTEDSYDGYSEEETQDDGSGSHDLDLHERIDSLIEEIGSGKEYGTMGDYYIKEIGCYVYPNVDVFNHFVDAEIEGAGWVESSNGCFVPVEYLEDYEDYISKDSGKEENGEEILEDVQPDPAVSPEDFNELKDVLMGMSEQDAAFHESVIAYTEAVKESMENISFQLSVISIVLVVLCVFLAFIAGNRIANTFFDRMRVG